ncbi:MAG: glutamate dehydrogenase, partial [Polyangiaceae bacterium]
CHPDGERVLLERGIEILPDILANSGGVTVSYYEWGQNKRSEHWTLEEVDEKLEKAMKKAYREVTAFAHSRKCDLRIAAYALALSRLEVVYGQREIFP